MLPRCLTVLAVLGTAILAPSSNAQGWPAPGDGFEWERVGGRSVDARDLIFDSDGRLWAAGSDGSSSGDNSVFVLASGSSGQWDGSAGLRSKHAILPLGRADTVLAAEGWMHRTTDGGATWERVSRDIGAVRNGLIEVPAGLTASDLPGDLRAGHLLAASRSLHDGTGVHRSTDRGATWHPVPGMPRNPEALIVLPPDHPTHPGRLLAAGLQGGIFTGVTADDGSLMMARTPESEPESTAYRATDHFAVFPADDPVAPGRLLMTGFLAGQAHNRVFTSDDGGDSWQERAALPEPSDGIPGDAWLVVVGPGSALAAGGRGVVYRTDDGGGSWRIVGRTPITSHAATSQEMLLGPDGRLYVGVKMAGNTWEWVYRTRSSYVSVSAGPVPPAVGALGLSVSPNPSRGRSVVRWRQGRAGGARVGVFDARGREVRVVAEGYRPPGEQTAVVETGGLAAGVYVVRVVGPGGSASARLAVVR